MDTHGTQPPVNGQEIQCSDCGSRYFISPGLRSSRCQKCGNIEFLALSAEPLSDIFRQTQDFLPQNVLPLPKTPRDSAVSQLEAFRGTPDGGRVQELLIQYQIEWQIWAMVVKNFADPAFHAAYLTQILSEGNFELATRRYQEHRGVMAPSKELAWQAEVADLMLERLENLSVVRMKMEGRGFRLPNWILLLPFESRVFKYGFFFFGIWLGCRLLGVL